MRRAGAPEGQRAEQTPIRYLDPNRKGQSDRGYLWVYGRPEGDLCFDWSLGRGKAAAKSIVRDFRGLLQSDGYQVYDHVSESRPIEQLGCWAHARRRFYNAYRAGEDGATHFLVLIRKLYATEAEMPQGADADAVVAIRTERSVPVLEQIKQSLSEDQEKHFPKSAMAEAIAYTRSQWTKFTAYVKHGRARIDYRGAKATTAKLTTQPDRASDPPDQTGCEELVVYRAPRGGAARRNHLHHPGMLPTPQGRAPGLTSTMCYTACPA